MDTERRPVLTPGIVIGGFIVAVGALLLLIRLGVITDAHLTWRLFWPAVVCVAGLLKLMTSGHPVGRIWGAVLAIIGGLLFRFNIGEIWPIFLIAIGTIMIWGAIERRRNGPPMYSGAVLNEWTAFGGGELINDSKLFQGGEVVAMFGGYQVDLREADFRGEATLYASAMFGGIEIRIPESWAVTIHGMPILGGYADKTRHPRPGDVAEIKRLVVKGFAVFGGVEIKN